MRECNYPDIAVPMAGDRPTRSDTRTATIGLSVGGRKLGFRLTVPAGPTDPIELLPIFRTLTDAIVEVAAENAEAEGAAISCRKGCGACCRQLVPISEVEAESLRRLVEALPEPRRSHVIERFEQALRRLDGAGLLEGLRTPQRIARDDIVALGDAYFAQGIACPFLEDESCSIHAERPLACREYLVTSPAANCAAPSAATIRMVAVPAKVSRAIRYLDTGRPNPSATWIPMILALEWPQAEQRKMQAGMSMVENLFRRLTGKPLPAVNP
jgi:Fe-S-cluster containining protein